MIFLMTKALEAANKVVVWQYVLGSILIALAIALIVLILLQSGNDKKLSGSIAGGSETFFGKSKGTSMDKVLSRLTIIGSILFVIVSVILTILISSQLGQF